MVKFPRRYPKTLLIKDTDWAIKMVNRLPTYHRDQLLGIADPSTNEIKIRTKQTPRDRLKTLVHELLHAFEFEYEIEINHKTIHELEDPIVDFLINNF